MSHCNDTAVSLWGSLKFGSVYLQIIRAMLKNKKYSPWNDNNWVQMAFYAKYLAEMRDMCTDEESEGTFCTRDMGQECPA